MEIIQFQIGRKQLIEKLNVLHTKYSNEFDVLFKPSINKLTEPWVIAKWYIEAIESFKKEKDLEDNIVQFITKKDEKYQLNKNRALDEFFGIGVQFIDDKKISANYRSWLLYIVSHLSYFGASNIWDFVEYYMNEEEIYADEIDFTENEEDKAEIIKRAQEYADNKERVLNTRISFNLKEPKKLTKPNKSIISQKAYTTILIGLNFIEQYQANECNIHDYENQDDYNNGTLPLNQMFFILDSWCDSDSFVSWYVFDQYIDIQANQVGTTRLTAKSTEEKEYDENDFNFEVIDSLIDLARNWYELEKLFYD